MTKKKYIKKIIKALEAMDEAESLLDYDNASMQAVDALNEYTEQLEGRKKFLQEAK